MSHPLSPGDFRRVALLAVTSAFFVPSARAADPYVEGEVIVTYRQGSTVETARTSAGRHSAKMARHFGWLSERRKQAMGVVSSSTKSTVELIAELKNDPDVLVAEPNYLRHVSVLQPNDASFSALWGLNNTGQSVNSTGGVSGDDVRFLSAWNLARPSSGEVVVAVMDTGLDTSHPDIVANLWTNPGENPNNNSDDDANGRINDVHGFDFVNNSGNVADSGDHGTHVAGTIAATGNNSQGVIGADFKAHVMVLKVSSNGTSISTSAELAALDYAAMMKSKGVNIVAINASFGGGSFSSAESAAITTAGNAGIVFCAAAGNEGANNDSTPTYPANYRLPNMIVVAASTQTDQLAGFSNRGVNTVDLAAPGTNIYSLKPTWIAGTTASVTANSTLFSASGLTYAGTTPGITATLINCGTGNSAAQFPATVTGNIALIQRGTETFATKLTHAMNAGAVGAIIYNNVSGSFNGTLGSPSNWIPGVSVPQASGTSLLAQVGTQVTLVNAAVPGDIYQFLDGTSMATPHVAAAVGFAALNFPADSVAQRIARILNNTTPVGALSGLVKTGGRLNLLKIVDSNANTLPDWWETDRFGALGANPADDSDGDGMTNGQEFLAATDPRNANSRLAVSSSALVENSDSSHGFQFTFPSVQGVSYRVEANATLSPDSWTPLAPDLIGTGNIMHVVDPISAGGRFYRVSVVP